MAVGRKSERREIRRQLYKDTGRWLASIGVATAGWAGVRYNKAIRGFAKTQAMNYIAKSPRATGYAMAAMQKREKIRPYTEWASGQARAVAGLAAERIPENIRSGYRAVRRVTGEYGLPLAGAKVAGALYGVAPAEKSASENRELAKKLGLSAKGISIGHSYIFPQALTVRRAYQKKHSRRQK